MIQSDAKYHENIIISEIFKEYYKNVLRNIELKNIT